MLLSMESHSFALRVQLLVTLSEPELNACLTRRLTCNTLAPSTALRLAKPVVHQIMFISMS
jgi:hypothetical protein